MTSSLKTGPSTTAPGLQALAVPGVCLLIGFLGYVSQLLFYTAPDLAPGPLRTPESVIFNLLLACLWWTYYKACTVEPGRYPPPNPHDPTPSAESEKYRPASTTTTATTTTTTTETTTTITTTLRWCKKCRAPKPLRAHHCRHCGRCIPKMDHHCPWTGNCVSMQTFPYFLRFLVFTNLSLWVLGSFVWERMAMIWSDRHLPAYLGPTLPHLVLLTAVSLVGSGTAIALGLLLFTTARGWVLNATMIEDWEVERHEAVLARQQRHDREDDSESDDDDDNNGKPRSRRQAFWQDTDPIIPRVEYPYDIGVFANMAQGMGTRNALKWFLPWAGGPVVDASGRGRGWGWEWEENGFNSRAGMWPPPDPEKLRRSARGVWPAAEKYAAAVAAASSTALSGEETKAAFAARQQADLIRRGHQRPAPAGPIHGEDNDDIMAELEEQPDNDEDYDDYDSDGGDGGAGQAWKDSESNTLWDYGVDEDAEEEDDARPFAARLQKVEEEQRVIELDDDDDDDEVPLAELIRRRKVRTTDGGED